MRLPADLDARSLSDLRALVIALVVKGTELERTVAAQRDEIARLKGLKGQPQIKPSGMEKASQALTQERATGKRRRKRAKSADLTIHEERIIKAGARPARLALQRLPDLRGSGSRAAPPCRAPAARALARPGRADHHGRHALRDRRPFRAGPAPLRVGAVPPGPSHHPAAARTALQSRPEDLQAPARALPDRWAGRVC